MSDTSQPWEETTEYNQGDIAVLTGTFTLADGVTLADPTTVVVEVQDSAGNVTTPEITKVSVGIYTAQVNLSAAVGGTWTYKFTGTGAVQAVIWNVFLVKLAPF